MSNLHCLAVCLVGDGLLLNLSLWVNSILSAYVSKEFFGILSAILFFDLVPGGHPNSPTYGHLKLPHLS